jgi:hypothetical protein
MTEFQDSKTVAGDATLVCKVRDIQKVSVAPQIQVPWMSNQAVLLDELSTPIVAYHSSGALSVRAKGTNSRTSDPETYSTPSRFVLSRQSVQTARGEMAHFGPAVQDGTL